MLRGTLSSSGSGSSSSSSGTKSWDTVVVSSVSSVPDD
jgi:hypothetical protein